MRQNRLSLFVLCLAAALLAFSCASVKPAPPQGVADTPAHHYAAGVKLLDAGQFARAADEFTRAKALDPDYAPAYEGLGLAYLGQHNVVTAGEQMALAKRKDRKYAPAYVGMGRVLAAKRDFKPALEEFEAALKLSPKSVPAHFYMGQTYLAMYEFAKAEQRFTTVLEIDPAFAPGRREWERSVKIRMAAPGTIIGKRIALAEPITRADLAALLATELGLEDKLRKRRPEVLERGYRPPQGSRVVPVAEPGALTDIDGHWAKASIELVSKLSLLDPFPDRTFKPDAVLSRATLAVVFQEILVVASGDEKLRTQFLGTPTPFGDVPSGHFAFNAVLLATTRGLMEADRKSGAFRLTEPVSGPEALLGIRKLAELF